MSEYVCLLLQADLLDEQSGEPDSYAPLFLQFSTRLLFQAHLNRYVLPILLSGTYRNTNSLVTSEYQESLARGE